MPLLKRKPHKLVRAPLDLAPDDEVFVCRLTGEIFKSYEAPCRVVRAAPSGENNLAGGEAQAGEAPGGGQAYEVEWLRPLALGERTSIGAPWLVEPSYLARYGLAGEDVPSVTPGKAAGEIGAGGGRDGGKGKRKAAADMEANGRVKPSPAKKGGGGGSVKRSLGPSASLGSGVSSAHKSSPGVPDQSPPPAPKRKRTTAGEGQAGGEDLTPPAAVSSGEVGEGNEGAAGRNRTKRRRSGSSSGQVAAAALARGLPHGPPAAPAMPPATRNGPSTPGVAAAANGDDDDEDEVVVLDGDELARAQEAWRHVSDGSGGGVRRKRTPQAPRAPSGRSPKPHFNPNSNPFSSFGLPENGSRLGLQVRSASADSLPGPSATSAAHGARSAAPGTPSITAAAAAAGAGAGSGGGGSGVAPKGLGGRGDAAEETQQQQQQGQVPAPQVSARALSALLPPSSALLLAHFFSSPRGRTLSSSIV
eukprot:jgi/Mesen1/1342/ME000013S00839